MLGIFVVCVVFSIVILLHEFGHFIMARRMGVKVERFSLGFGKVLFSRRSGDTEYAISTIPFGGYVKMAGEEPRHGNKANSWELSAKPPGKRFWILFAGAALNYLFAFLIFSFITPTARIGVVLKDMPAYTAGMEVKDRILSIDGRDIKYWYEVLDIVSKDIEAKPLKIKLERDSRVMELAVVPKIVESKNIFGRRTKVAKIGVGYYGDVEILKARPIGYLATGIRQTRDNTAITYRYIWYLLTGRVSFKGSVTGPVGIAVILGKAAKIGMPYLIYLIAHINLALAIFNLLPFPVLDGGHIMFLGLERLMARPLSVKTQEIIQYVAISVLVVFFLFVSYNDVVLWVLNR